MGKSESTWEDLTRETSLPTGEGNTVAIRRNRADVIEIDEKQFLPTGHILLPRPHPSGEGEQSAPPINGLSIIAHALSYAKDNSDRVLLVAAHAEALAGADGKPDPGAAATCAIRRAENVCALLKGDRDAWAASCDGGDWLTLQLLLRWASMTHGLGCDPGPPNGINNVASRAALLSFRRAVGVDSGQGADFPMVRADDWAAFFDFYERSIAKLLEVKSEDMAQAYAKISFHPPEQIGCGALWSAPSGRDAEQLRSGSKRRVDLVFFEKAEPIPEIDGVQPPGAMLYANDKRARKIFLEPKPPPAVCCVRMTGMFFDTNKCFLLPDAMRGMRRMASVYKELPDSEILIVGHADTSGEPDINDPLSLERADAVAAFLKDDADAWLDYYGDGVADAKRWGAREDMAMLSQLDGGKHLSAPSPIKSYQQSRGLSDDGIAGPKTRGQLIKDYMAIDGTSLPEGIAATTHGCGENFPLAGADGSEDAAGSRRVECFVFEDGIDPPPPGDNSGPGSTEYPQWLSGVTSHFDLGAARLTDPPHYLAFDTGIRTKENMAFRLTFSDPIEELLELTLDGVDIKAIGDCAFDERTLLFASRDLNASDVTGKAVVKTQQGEQTLRFAIEKATGLEASMASLKRQLENVLELRELASHKADEAGTPPDGKENLRGGVGEFGLHARIRILHAIEQSLKTDEEHERFGELEAALPLPRND